MEDFEEHEKDIISMAYDANSGRVGLDVRMITLCTSQMSECLCVKQVSEEM